MANSLPNEQSCQADSRSVYLCDKGYADICNMALCQNYPPATEVFKQGTLASVVYIIDFGMVKLTSIGIDGEESIVGLRYSGDLLGIASVILDGEYPVSCITLTSCRLRLMPASIFRQVLETNAHVLLYLLKGCSNEILNQMSQLIDTSFSAQQRLKHLLAQFLQALDGQVLPQEVRLHLPLKHWELAQLVGITPQHLSRLLKQLQDKRIIRREKSAVVIINPEALKEL